MYTHSSEQHAAPCYTASESQLKQRASTRARTRNVSGCDWSAATAAVDPADVDVLILRDCSITPVSRYLASVVLYSMKLSGHATSRSDRLSNRKYTARFALSIVFCR